MHNLQIFLLQRLLFGESAASIIEYFFKQGQLHEMK